MENLVDNLFGGAYRDKIVLVTGHTGFKGSWLSLWLTMMGARVIGYALAPPTIPNHFDLLNLDMTSIEGDIRDEGKLCNVLISHKPEVVFHLAAQPLVRRSYGNPVDTYQTNVIGTLNVYEACRHSKSVKALVSVTTDKVYENKEWHRGYRENDELGGFDPYSSSKACAEILTSSYRNSFFPISKYGVNHWTLLATARAGNVIGGGDWGTDRLVPDIVKATAEGKPVVIRNPHAVRPWQHALESLSGYLLLGQKLLTGNVDTASAWNFGPATKEAATVNQLVTDMQKQWLAITFITGMEQALTLHETKLLILDSAKSINQLGWHPVWNFDETVERTTKWYRSYYENREVKSLEDILVYVKKAVEKGLCWTVPPLQNREAVATCQTKLSERLCATF